MSSLLPCRSPAWQAPVCEDQSVSHRSSRWEPPRSQARERWARCRRGSRAAGRRGRGRRSRGTAMPGTSLRVVACGAAPGAATTLRYQASFSSIASSPKTIAVTPAIAIVTTTPSKTPSISAPGRTSIAKVTSRPLRSSDAPPSVSTVSGSARRARTGQISALRSPISAAAPSAAGAPSKTKPGIASESSSSVSASSRRTSSARQTARRLMVCAGWPGGSPRSSESMGEARGTGAAGVPSERQMRLPRHDF